jgi:hypothetical protein
MDKPMTRFDIFHMIKRRAKAAALPYSTCCHTFRFLNCRSEDFALRFGLGSSSE